MDRRMYRRNMGNNCGYSKNISPNRHEHGCDDMCGDHMHEDMCGMHDHEDMCCRHGHDDMCDRHEDMCDRDRHDGDFDRFPLAMCYVPWQCFRELYDNEFEALAYGTLFKELDLRWYGRGCK